MNIQQNNSQLEKLTLEETIFKEIVSSLYTALPGSVAATSIIGASMVVILWQFIDTTWLSIWLLVLVTISFCRFVAYKLYTKSKKTIKEIYYWDRVFFVLLLLTALTWSCVSIWLLPEDGSTQHYLPALILIGICAGAVTTLGFSIRYMSLYLMFLLVPLFIREVMIATTLSNMVAFLIVIFIGLIVVSARRVNQTLVENISLHYSYKEYEAELINSKDAAIAANSVKDNFISMISHELRTPLNAILGFGQLLQMSEKPELNKEQSENTQGILDSGKHLLSLIEELLDLSKIESHKLYVAIDNISLADNLSESIAILSPVAAGFNIKLINNVENKYLIKADAKRLKQIFINLVSNAIKYNHEKGNVNISVKELADEKIRVSITDDGIGLTPEQQENLFKPFQRYSDEKEGLGLGLYITKNLVELMEGTIGVDSVYGEGSTFWFELKLSQKM